MVKSKSFGARVFVVVNALVIGLLAASCLIPLIHVFAISLSDKSSASGGLVTLWPVNFTLESYKYVINRAPFWTAMLVSLKRVLVGVSLNMFFCIICAYPLSKETNQFRARTVYAWYFFITMLISGGMIPLYMVINLTGLKGTFWSLVIPGAVPVYNIILLLNFFRQTPRELEEAATIEGAGFFKRFVKIVFPLSKGGFISGFMLIFVSIMKELDLIILIMTPKTSTLPYLAFQYQNQNCPQASNCVAIVMFSIVFLVYALANIFGDADLAKSMAG